MAFYESAKKSHPSFAAYMPTFMGTLTLSTPADSHIQAPLDGVVDNTTLSSIQQDILEDRTATQHGPSQGKKLDTDLAIVLLNAAADFIRPNILDVKLGAQLCDSSAPPSKRARLDKVALETTSSSLGFRIAGMKVWQGCGQDNDEVDEHGYRAFGKMYGRQFNADNVTEGFKSYLFVESAGIDEALGRVMARRLAGEVEKIRKMLEAEESRMYGASILFVYEGDGEALKRALDEEEQRRQGESKGFTVGEGPLVKGDDDNDNDDDDDDDDEVKELKVHTVKLIDFAHASWTPGQGPDENALRGVRNVEKILYDLGQAWDGP